MKEKPCFMEVPSTRKCLPGGMLVTVRLTLTGPAACVPKGSSSHSSFSTKSFWDTGLEHHGTQGQPGVSQAWLYARRKSQVSSEPEDGFSPPMPSCRAGRTWQGRDQPCPVHESIGNKCRLKKE